jgi:hypothetical protein
MESEVDVREALPEHSNHVGERLVRCGGHVADDEFAELATLGALCGADGALGLGKCLPRLREKCLSGRREFDPPLRPTKQAGAEFILEAPYLLAQRRLRDVKPRGRPAEMQLFGNGEKGAEVSQLHPGMISRDELVVSESILDAEASRVLDEDVRPVARRGAMADHTDRTVLVTGAATGMGFGIAQAFHASGARVALGDVNEAGLAKAADRLHRSPRVFRLEKLFRAAEQALGPVDAMTPKVNVVALDAATGALRWI